MAPKTRCGTVITSDDESALRNYIESRLHEYSSYLILVRETYGYKAEKFFEEPLVVNDKAVDAFYRYHVLHHGIHDGYEYEREEMIKDRYFDIYLKHTNEIYETNIFPKFLWKPQYFKVYFDETLREIEMEYNKHNFRCMNFNQVRVGDILKGHAQFEEDYYGYHTEMVTTVYGVVIEKSDNSEHLWYSCNPWRKHFPDGCLPKSTEFDMYNCMYCGVDKNISHYARHLFSAIIIQKTWKKYQQKRLRAAKIIQKYARHMLYKPGSKHAVRAIKRAKLHAEAEIQINKI